MNTLDSLFDWFFTATVRGALLTLAVLALQAALRGWMPARWRYALWLPVIFVLASPVLPQSRWSLENWVDWKTRDAQIAVAAEDTSFDLAPIADAPQSMAASTPSALTDWRRVAQTGWLAGAAGVAGFVLAAYARTMRRIRRGAVPQGADLAAMLAETACAWGMPRAPRLLVSTEVRSPAVCGFLLPMLLLPADFPAAFTPREARLVLLHEITHLKRQDLPLNWLLWLLQAIHWCNPVLWFAFGRIRAGREAACDAQVLAGSVEDRRADYGHALLKLEGALAQSRLSLGFVGIFERAAGMPARLRAIAGYRRGHAAWGWLAGCLIAGLVFVGATRAQQTQRTSDAELLQKLNAIVIPKLILKNATVSEAVDLLGKKSVEFDPAKIGAKISVHPEVFRALAADTRITLSLTNIPLGEAMKYVTSLAGLKYRWENRAFTVVPLGWQEPMQVKRWKLTSLMRTNLDYHKADDLKEFWIASGVEFPEGASVAASADFRTITMKNTQDSLDLVEALLLAADQTFVPSDDPTGTKPFRRKLDTIIIPALELRDATLREAVDFLKRKGAEMDTTEPEPARRGMSFVLKLDKGDSPPVPEARITLSLANVTLGEALRAVAAAAKVRCKVEPYAVTLVPLLEETGVLMTREWRIGRRLGAMFVDQNAAGRINVKLVLSKAGLTFPEGATATFIPQKYLLVMRNTETNCERLDALVMEDAMPQTPPEPASR